MPTGFESSLLNKRELYANAVRTGRSSFKTRESDKGQVTSSTMWSDKLPHPSNMDRYDALCNDPETRIGIDLLTDMIVGVGFYTQMPEKDAAGEDIDPNHPNKKMVDEWSLRINADRKFKEIERTKLSKGFCPVEVLPDKSLKILPPESFFIWRDKKGKLLRYTQDVAGSEVARWETDADMETIILFIHNEDTSHVYGHALVDSIADLIEARKQINIDMPKIIHRYSAPKGIWEYSMDIQEIFDSVTGADVDEDIFLSGIQKDELRHTFVEPTSQVKFLPYIEQIYFQIGEALHAPLILLLKNATEASAHVMLESVDRFVQGEQRYDSSIIVNRIIKPMTSASGPVPELKWGATKQVFDDITLADIGSLKGNGTITWPQAQDIIRQKGIPLLEVEEPEAPPILPGLDQTSLLDQPKMTMLQAGLNVIRDNFHQKTITVSEAIREGDRCINAFVAKSKHETLRKLSESLGKPVDKLSPESERCFILLRNEMFDAFREAIMPSMRKALGENDHAANSGTRKFTVLAHQ